MQAILTSVLVLGVSLPRGLSVHLSLEEAGRQTRYSLQCTQGLLLVEPEGEKVSLLVDVAGKTVTLIRQEDRVYCRIDKEALELLRKAGIVEWSWFPWVYETSPDLLEEIELKEAPSPPQDKGRRRVEVYSKRYGRVVASYWLDPRGRGDWYFQWRRVYFDLWDGEGEGKQAAQRARLELYGRLKGLPLQMEERFRLLTRPRVLRFEDWEPVQKDDAFRVPEDYTEKSVAQLVWEDFLRRFERWLRPK